MEATLALHTTSTRPILALSVTSATVTLSLTLCSLRPPVLLSASQVWFGLAGRLGDRCETGKLQTAAHKRISFEPKLISSKPQWISFEPKLNLYVQIDNFVFRRIFHHKRGGLQLYGF